MKKFFANQKMSRKILAAPAVVFLFLIILAAVSYVGLSQQQEAINDLYSVRFQNYQHITTVISKVNAIHRDVYKILTWTGVGIDKPKIEAVIKDVKAGLVELHELMGSARNMEKLNATEKKYHLAALKELEVYKKLAEDTIDVSDEPGSATAFMISLESQYQAMTKTLQELWHLESQLSKESYQFSIDSYGRVLMAFFFVFVAAILISLLITFLCVRAIVAPVNKTIVILEDIAKGEGDLTKRLDIATQDEIGELSRWFNEHIGNLHHIISMVSGETKKINSYAGTVSCAVDSQATFSMQLSASVTEIAATMEEFSATADQIAIHSKTVAEHADKTLQDTREGAVCVETLTAKMNEINRANEASINEIIDLGKRSRQITAIMEIINGIANQTRLIAFNAALEASSAGEAGRRFGVVAVEIRRLADSVVESTAGIEGEISNILDSVNNLVIASEKSSKGIHEGLAFSDKTVRMLEAIVEGVEATADASRQISLSTQQQVIATGQVAFALREIQQGVHSTSQSGQETTSISKDLVDLSGKLEALVGKFRI